MNKPPRTDLPSPSPRVSSPDVLASEIIERLTYRIGKDAKVAKPHDWLTATILVIRDRIIDRWMESTRETYEKNEKRVYYLSLEFLIGRLMRDAVSNLELMDEMRSALVLLGVDLDVVAALEPDAALGNGGLGRLAACFMESMATVDIPAYGYGIRYVHGLFRQQMQDGWQVELPETWLAHGNPWEFERRESSYEVGFGGSVETIGEATDGTGALRLATAGTCHRHRLRHTRRRLAREAREHAQAVDRSADRPDPARRLQRRRPYRRPQGKQQGGDPCPRPLPGRCHAGRPGIAAAPGILLLLRLASGHPAPPHPALQRIEEPAGQGGHPAERHPPGCRRRRDGPAAVRRPPPLLRAILGHRPQVLRLHEPHAPARGAGKLAGAALRAAAAPAHADRLRHQRHGPARRRGRGTSTTPRSATSR